MTNDFDVDVLICGAGAAGLTLAIDLARRGISFQLIEKMDAPFHGSRGKGIQPRTLEIFEDLGVVDKIAALGAPYPKERIYQADGSFRDAEADTGMIASQSEPYGQRLMLPQFLTEQILRERLAEFGHAPHYGSELAGLTQDAEGVVAQIRKGQATHIMRARWLVGADGGRSFVRHTLGIAFPGKSLEVRALVADVRLQGLSDDVWHQFGMGGMGSQIMFCPLAGTQMFQVQGPVPLEGDIDLSAEGLNALIVQRTGRTDIVVTSVSWASAYHMSARLAETYRMGRIFLVGDAAHIHPPTGAQGLNTSVQDAYNLGWKIAAILEGADEELLESYEAERRPVAAAMLGLSTALLEEAKRANFKRGHDVAQIDIGYTGSPLIPLTVATSERIEGVLAGDRAPDAVIKGAAGQSSRLFDLFQGPAWTLLCYEAAPSIPARRNLHIHHIGAGGDVLDHLGGVQATYALTAGDQLLVRPDGYIAGIFGKDETALLETYLVKMGVGASEK